MTAAPTPDYDVIVIGAGPAGLSAAQVAARAGLRTLVLERLERAGELAHPCGGTVAPLPGIVSGRYMEYGIHLPELDLVIPTSQIIGRPTTQRYLGPGRHAFAAVFANDDEFPVAVIDKCALLSQFAHAAANAGAELRFGTPVSHLLCHAGQVTGVVAAHSEIRSRLVIGAEGVSRQFAQAAGLYDGLPGPNCHAVVVSEDLEAPAAGPEHVGQINTFGQKYTSTPGAMGAVEIPRPGQAQVYFSVFASSPQTHTEQSLWASLDEYKRADPRVSPLLDGARVLRRAGCRMTIQAAPQHVTRDGFIGVGDAVGPGGHLGIVACLFLGRQAARVAIRALQAGPASAAALADYDRQFHGPILQGAETESRLILGLADLPDDEIDRLCQTLSRLNLAPFFFGGRWPVARETVTWAIRSGPLIWRDRHLLRRLFAGPGPARPAVAATLGS